MTSATDAAGEPTHRPPPALCSRERPAGPSPRRGNRRSSARRRTGVRGQTTIDYAIGAGIFLLAVAFTFAFVPGILDPFTGGAGQDRSVVADRVATELASGELGDPGDPYELDTACTLGFFSQVTGDVSADSACAFETDDAHSVSAALGIADLESVHVTLENGSAGAAGTDVVCRDGIADVVECGGYPELATGTAPPARASVVTAQRSVRVDGAQYTLFVRVW